MLKSFKIQFLKLWFSLDLIRENRKHQNAPLVTSKLRQNQEEERRTQFLQKYPTTILRVQFADGLILQMPLPSQTHLSQVLYNNIN